MMPTDSDTLVLVFDGATARFFRPHHNGHLEQTLDEVNKRLNLGHGEAAGRSDSGVAHIGGAAHMHESKRDPHKLEKHDFIHALVKELDLAFDKNAFKNLILIGQERALGEFRKLAPEKLKRVTLHEIPKDLTKLPLNDLEQHLIRDLGPK
jgi:protein required for attachment to host cells